jgi:hypothetical protein
MPDKDQLYVEVPPYTPPRHVTDTVPADLLLERPAQITTRRELIRFGAWVALGLRAPAMVGLGWRG